MEYQIFGIIIVKSILMTWLVFEGVKFLNMIIKGKYITPILTIIECPKCIGFWVGLIISGGNIWIGIISSIINKKINEYI